MARLFLFFISLTLCLVSGFELNRRHQESRLLMLQTEPLNRADTLLVQNRWQEAKFLARVIKEQPDLGDTRRAQSIEMAADAALDSTSLQTQAFLLGMISGEANNGAGLLGALTIDLFVIGDIRDLIVQGYREVVYQNGDEVILALSATGLSLALLPGLHWAPAILKGLKRTGALSERFLKMLGKHSRTALNTGDFKPLAGVINDFGHATRNLGPGPVSGAMKAVETESDLAKLASASAINPKQSYAVSTLAGQRGFRQLNKTGQNIGAVARKLKVTSRLAKSAKKIFGALPDNAVLAVFALGVCLLLMTVFLKRKRQSTRALIAVISD